MAALVAAIGVTVPGAASARPAIPTSARTAAACIPPSLHDCYGYDTMQAYADKVLPLVTTYFRTTYRNMRLPVAYIYVRHGAVTSMAGCHDQADSMVYAYCSGDHKIYLGQDFLWRLYAGNGDIAPAVGLAHELGHNVQTRAGVPSPRTNQQSIRYEDQADCIAGSWIRYAYAKGYLEDEDLGSISKLIAFIADNESAAHQTHGNLKQRFHAMFGGIVYGLDWCNRYYPNTPISTH